MAKGHYGPGMGRPKIEFNWDDFDKLCGIWCTLTEIADFFDCSEDTVERRVREKYDCTFAERRAIKSSAGKRSLRRKQYEAAMAGDRVMLIWLGKQYLGQAERQETVVDVGDKTEKLIVDLSGNYDPTLEREKPEEEKPQG